MSKFRVLFIGDIVGRPGRRGVRTELPALKEQYKLDLVIANVENAAGGFGITKKVAEELHAAGIDLMTSGNHIWDKKDSYQFIDECPYLIRPANYPPGVPGRGYLLHETPQCKVGLLNLSGRVFLTGTDDPFRVAHDLIENKLQEADLIIVDFHAEATAEKVALGWFLDGRVSAVLGTHTHIQTADNRVLEQGTAYITDVGMTGPFNSILGMKRSTIINKFLNQMPTRFEVEKGPYTLQGVVITFDLNSAQAETIERIFLTERVI
ncbi:MAG: TIGR00282 family metallophosphoesterase [Firmicutes bacterium]|nr:TIGR00282 family metallophosphoesterase [Bacillota bacterium]